MQHYSFHLTAPSNQASGRPPTQTIPDQPRRVELGPYALEIPQGELSPTGHVRLNHGQQYTIRLSNSSAFRCDAKVSIDGHAVGVWRLPAHATIEVARPVHDTGCFTFYAIGTREAELAHLRKNEELGLITVEVTPERSVMTAPFFSADRTAGGTGLSGMSHQQFAIAEAIDPDCEQTMTLHVRLIKATEPAARPLVRFTVRPPAVV